MGKDAVTGGDHPFWFDLWRNRGWSSRVARNWLMDAPFRDRDRGFLAIVLPTLLPEQKSFVAAVLDNEGHAFAEAA